MRIWLLVLWTIITIPVHGDEDSEIKRVASPDGNFLAATREIPDEGYVWRKDLDRFRLVVWPARLGTEFGDRYLRWDCGRQRVMSNMSWSPDSKFLVLTTVSSGGHSPWHFDSYVFCVADRTVRYMDGTIGPVVKPDFQFIAAHRLVISLGPDYDHPTVKQIDLGKETPNMKVEATLKYISMD